ncbi:MAG: glucosamine-6-phosphate deaminase [Anaerolineae bacterium]|nr:glucosamine-6-phosphate deaminase [Candidatus Roseilinea sp.]MDW8451503.1 glucosamine-6-phosphate deaminase [Anaerolineae bacterium]
MNLIVANDYADLSRVAAERIAAAVARKPDAAIVLATGNTPMGAYAELARMQRAGAFDATHIRPFQLDAYLGIPFDDERALYGWLERAFLRPLGIARERVVMLPDGAPDPEAACRAYDAAVDAAGGFDLAVLGLGPNGHLGFNEPPSPADAPTRRVILTEASLNSNGPYWGGRDRVPREAITCGMRHLLAARETLLLVSGAHKREILRATLYGPVTSDVPASLLRLAGKVTVIADAAACGRDDPTWRC